MTFPRSLCALLLSFQLPVASGTAAPAAPQASSSERLKWFTDARFGMFIHWGIYAVPAGVWNGRSIAPKQGGEWILKLLNIPIADYKGFGKDFTAAKYDPAAWARLAKEAGMKYVVITAKHHDGLALYDSAASDWNVVQATAAKRDLIAPLEKAVRAEGLKFGLYYSQSQDWTNPGGGIYGNGPTWDPAQRGDYDAYLQKVAAPQIEEILTRYHPDIIWWDTPVSMNPARVKPFADLLAKLSPEIISNNRLGSGFKGDTKTPEQHIPARGYPGELFEVCMTMNDTWGFKTRDENWKSVRVLLRNLSDIASKGGNFLLNVGPNAEGEIPAASVERLQAMGRWMKVNGEAIYGTEAGPFPRRLEWGRATQKRNASGGVTLYLHVWDWPEDGRILLPTLKETPTAGRVLATGEKVTSASTAEGLVVTLPKTAPDPDVSIVALEFSGPLTVTQEALVSPGPDGRIALTALDADASGSLGGNIKVEGRGVDAFLTQWTDPAWRLDYRVKTPAAHAWTVLAEVATADPVQLTLDVKKVVTPVAVAATGGPGAWKTVELGRIDLPAGETGFSIVPVKEGWKGSLSLRRVWLTPRP